MYATGTGSQQINTTILVVVVVVVVVAAAAAAAQYHKDNERSIRNAKICSKKNTTITGIQCIQHTYIQSVQICNRSIYNNYKNSNKPSMQVQSHDSYTHRHNRSIIQKQIYKKQKQIYDNTKTDLRQYKNRSTTIL